MSNRWPGGLIRKTPVTPAGPLQNGAAPGMWTLAEASYWVKQGLWPTQGNILVVEDAFSTYLYTGNGSTQTITNGINLSGQGGLVWLKARTNTSGGATSHALVDTVRGASSWLASEATSSANTNANLVTGFLTSGFSVGNAPYWGNENAIPYVSWTFREAPNFFDVVTYTGDGVAGREIAHNLGSVPGMVIVKRTDAAANWVVWQRSLSDPSKYLVLNLTDATATDTGGPWGPTSGGYTTNASAFTSTFFRVANDLRSNASGGTYVAYVFAHDTSSTGLIQCGSFTAGSNSAAGSATINLGWEPQWILTKNATGSSTASWQIYDNMRGLTAARQPSYPISVALSPNTSSAESDIGIYSTNATGFVSHGGYSPGDTIIYVAIRRGPMRTPTLGTSVFTPTATSTDTATTGFPVDLIVEQPRTTSGVGAFWGDRLRGAATGLNSSNTNAETAWFTSTWSQNNVGVTNTGMGYGSSALWSFRRAPGFFDEVCYTGTGVVRTVTHNLGVAPELMIVKRRDTSGFGWPVYSAPTGEFYFMYLNTTDAKIFADVWKDTSPTSSVFTVGTGTVVNGSGATYVAYLFASAPGVSKVGSYTGNGSSQTINCAFTTGARFVLIKRTDSTGDWYVWDSARGIVAGNDPYLALNSTAAEVTTNDSVDTDNTGFIVNQVAASNINVNAATYIFLAIA